VVCHSRDMAALVAARGCLAPLLTTKPKHEGGMRRAEIGSLANSVDVAQALSRCLAQQDGCCMGCGASPDHGALLMDDPSSCCRQWPRGGTVLPLPGH
jgi:hypothetical protein